MLKQHRSTQRHAPRGREDEERLVADMIELTRQYGRYGYRRIAALLRDAGWHVNDKRVERMWRREGFKVSMKQAKSGRIWLNDGSCICLKPEYKNHVWSYDFVHHRTDDGRAFRTLKILDEFSREYLEIRVKRKLNSTDVVDALTDLFAFHHSFVQTMALSLSLKSFVTGYQLSVQRPPTSNQHHPGKTATAKASTPDCGMNC